LLGDLREGSELPLIKRKNIFLLRQKPGNSIHRNLFPGLFVPFHLSFDYAAFHNIKF